MSAVIVMSNELVTLCAVLAGEINRCNNITFV